jgi:hypothetical protein
MTGEPCPFDTLKFTGPDTRLYIATSVNWQQVWKNFQEQITTQAPLHAVIDQLNSWAKTENIDVEKNIIDPLGSEYSMQMEWPADSTYPDVSFFLKVDKPDDFKPTIAAMIDTARKAFSSSAVITEMTSDGHKYATVKPVLPVPFSPTITEDGPWFGLFLNSQNAVRSMARDESRGLLHNDDFNRQIGDERKSASEIIFFDSPKLIDQTYRTALPYLSMAAMFNPAVASVLKDRHLPADLKWLEPMNTWSTVVTSDDDGITGYSRSGVGNQGIMLVGVMGGAAGALQAAHIFPQAQPPAQPHRFTTPVPGNPNAPAAPDTTMPPTSPAPAPASSSSSSSSAGSSTPSDANSATPTTPPNSTH